MASVMRFAESAMQPFAQAAAAFSLDKTLKESLADMHQRFNQIIATCRSELILGAAEEAHLAINATRIAYRDALDHTLNRVDQTILQTLLGLDSLMKEMEARNYSKIESLLDQVQSIVNQLPFANSYPTISSTWPRCVVWPVENAATRNIVVSIKGHFPQMGGQDAGPSLSFNHHTYQPIVLLSSKLGFQVPLDKIFSSVSDRLSVGELVVPHIASATDYRFPISIGALPQSPGSIVVEYHKTVIQREISEPHQKERVQLSSTKGAGHRLQQKTIAFQAKPGWKVLDHGFEPTPEDKRKGDYKLVCQSASDTHIEYYAETRPHRDNRKCGQLRFMLFFKEYRDVPTAAPIKKELLNLGWGEKSSPIPLETGHWKVVFIPFDGSPTCELIKPEADNPFINVSVIGNQLQISAKRADEVHLAEAITAIGSVAAQSLPNPSTAAISMVQSDLVQEQLRSKL